MRTKRGFECRGISKGSSSSQCSPASTCPTFFSKRGQVTVFIIVGIAILFLFAGILYFSKSSVRERFTVEGDPVLAQVPQEFMPLQSYTENCLNQIGRRGLRIVGEQGGYIYPNLVGEYSASDPTDADGLDLEPAKVPYWHYNVEPNNANKISFSSLQPKLYASEDPEMSIEAQLGRYVDEKLTACLNEYEPFIPQGFQVQILSGPDTEVRVGESTVNFLLNLDVDAARGEAQQKMEQFYVKIPLRLKHYYEVAEEIRKAEQNYSFMERQGLDLIEIYSQADPNKLPPPYDFQDGYVGVHWTTPDVRMKMQSLLSSNVPLLRLLGSGNMFDYQYPVSELSQVFQANYDQTIISLDGAEEMEVSFDYFNWPIYLYLTKDETIGPQEFMVTNTISSFPQFTLAMQRYRNYYDVSYPVLVTIHDRRAFDGEGFSFNFALESNIRNNWVVADASTTISIPPVPRSMVCDEDKRGTELVSTHLVDSYTGEGLEMVRIGLTIPEEKECFIGTTDSEGRLEANYPLITGGVVNFLKEGYLSSRYPIDTYSFKDETGMIGYAIADYPEEVVPLHKFKLINISVRKENFEKCIEGNCFYSSVFPSNVEEVLSYKPVSLSWNHRWVHSGVRATLNPEETAAIFLERVEDAIPGVSEGFRNNAVVHGDEKMAIELVPGKYKVTGMLNRNELIVIPKETRCVEVEVISGVWEEEECYDIKETVLEGFMTGSFEWDTPETYFEITPEELYSSSEIIFNIPSFNLLNVPEVEHFRVIEDVQVVGNYSSISRLPEIRMALEPAFR